MGTRGWPYVRVGQRGRARNSRISKFRRTYQSGVPSVLNRSTLIVSLLAHMGPESTPLALLG